MMKNGTLMQYFEWYLPADATLWKKAAEEADKLGENGITAVWLPPAYKGANGINDVGYGVYDLYDLGEFDQKGTVATKYGTKDEYLAAIKAFHKSGIDVYADIVLNQKMGADETEEVSAEEVNFQNRNQEISGEEKISAWTKFTFPGRNNKYSDFKWNYIDFDGIDWDQKTNRNNIFLFEGKKWQAEVDNENCNYDYLMGADLDFYQKEVVDELTAWGKWYLNFTGVDGLRLDAVKHIDAGFFHNWLPEMRKITGKELFAVGEYWKSSKDALENYLSEVDGDMSLFDVPLHFNLFNASSQGDGFDMGSILNGSLVAENPLRAVTFSDNHDTQAGQALCSCIQPWFKPMSYALILLMQSGYPCVFYGDYYGIPHNNQPPVTELPLLISIREKFAYGNQNNYFDDRHIVGFTREGCDEVPNSSVAVLINNSVFGQKRMYVGKRNCGKVYHDAFNSERPDVTIDSDGCGTFLVSDRYISVYIIK